MIRFYRIDKDLEGKITGRLLRIRPIEGYCLSCVRTNYITGNPVDSQIIRYQGIAICFEL